MIWAAALAVVASQQSAIEADFIRCAEAYRATITGKGKAAHPFACAEQAAAANKPVTTFAFVQDYQAAAQAGQRWIDELDDEAGRSPSWQFPPARLAALSAARATYRVALCDDDYGSLTGGTVERSNAAICEARDVDAQIDDLLALLKEAGVIPNGR